MANEQYTEPQSERLRILLAGRALSYAEAMRWYRVTSGGRLFFPILCILLIAILSFGTLMSAPLLILNDWTLIPVLFLLLVAMIWTTVAVIHTLRIPKKDAEARFQWYNDDKTARETPVRIEFYETYLTFHSLRGTQTMRFDEILRCVETEDGIALNDGCRWLILRAQDMVKFDAVIVKAYLAEKVGRERFHSKAEMKTVLTVPMVIPEMPMTQQPLVQVKLPYESTELYRKKKKSQYRALQTTVILVGLLCGTLLATEMAITPWVSLDAMILCIIGVLLGWIVSAVMFAWYRPQRKEPLVISFYEDGLQAAIGDAYQFCVKEKLYLQAEKQQLTLFFENKEKIYIPWNAANQPDVLKALAGFSE